MLLPGSSEVRRGAARCGEDGPGVVWRGKAPHGLAGSGRARRDRARLGRDGSSPGGTGSPGSSEAWPGTAWQGLARLDEDGLACEDGCGEAGSGGARVGGAGSGSARLGEDGLGRAGAGVGRGRGPSLNAAHLGRKETLTWNRDHSIRNDSSRRESRIGSSRPRRHTRAPGRFDRKHFKAVVPKDRTKAKAARRLTLLAAVLGIALLLPRRRAVVWTHENPWLIFAGRAAAERMTEPSIFNERADRRSRCGTSAWAAWRSIEGLGVFRVADRGQAWQWPADAVGGRGGVGSRDGVLADVCVRSRLLSEAGGVSIPGRAYRDGLRGTSLRDEARGRGQTASDAA